MKLKKIISTIPLTLSLSGCFGYMVPGENFKGPQERPEWVQEYYSYTKAPIALTKDETKESTENYTLRRLEFKSAMHTFNANDDVRIDYYDLKTEQKTPLIIVSPILGGSNKVAKLFAEYFANHELAVALVHRPPHREPEESNYAQSLELLLKQPIIDLRRTIDLFETFNDIDAEKIGSFGVSMGSIRNASLAGVEPRLKANIFVMCGADLPYILSKSHEGGVVSALRNVGEKTDLNSFFESLRKTIKTDPKNLAMYINDETTLMFLTIFDEVVPAESQRKLRDLIGHPSVAYLWSGHYTALLYALPPTNYIQRTALSFFKNKLE